MKKILSIIGFAALAAVGFQSCEEVPVLIDLGGDSVSVDTTYVVSNIETPQAKKYLIEELSGVQCVNCPDGIVKLNEMNTSGPFAGKMTVVSIHVGTFAWFKEGHSKQDFVVQGSDQLLSFLGGDPGKPCAAFDRININGNVQDQLLFSGYPQWSSFLTKASDSSSSTAPVNIHIETTELETDRYRIKVRLHYTEAITNGQYLNIYLTESKIIDAMIYGSSNIDDAYEFNHVLRSYITPPTGKVILSDVTIEPGRVYEYNTVLEIDRDDTQQSFWKPENMEVVAFVSSKDGGTKKVYQSTYEHLVP